MNRLKNFLSIAWASPMTFLGLVLVCLPHAMGWYKYTGIKGLALTFSVNYRELPKDLQRRWQNKRAHTLGNVVVLNCDQFHESGRAVLAHELEHVRQYGILGIFFPLVYLVVWLAIATVCKLSNPRYSHAFEIEARRAAGQVVDVEGLIKKLKASKKRTT